MTMSPSSSDIEMEEELALFSSSSAAASENAPPLPIGTQGDEERAKGGEDLDEESDFDSDFD